MQTNFTDEGILIDKQIYGNTSLILTMFTQQYGIVKGLLKGGQNSKYVALLQLGNVFQVTKKARLETHLGWLKLELIDNIFINVFDSSLRLLVLASTCGLIVNLIAEKEPLYTFYIITQNMLQRLANDGFLTRYFEWELELLKNLGYGLELDKCVVSHTKSVHYVSPKTGKSVSYKVGQPYANKLLALPVVWRDITATQTIMSNMDLYASSSLLSYFLEKFAKEYYKHLPDSRNLLMTKIKKLNN